MSTDRHYIVCRLCGQGYFRTLGSQCPRCNRFGTFGGRVVASIDRPHARQATERPPKAPQE